MRIFPIALIAIGVFGILKHFGFIDPAFVHLLWPLILIGVGVAMLMRGPRWRADMHERRHDRWERRMSRHFGPGWMNLSEERQWHSHEGSGSSRFPASTEDQSPPKFPNQPPTSGEQR